MRLIVRLVLWALAGLCALLAIDTGASALDDIEDPVIAGIYSVVCAIGAVLFGVLALKLGRRGSA
jgi:MFS family permease